MVEIPLRFGITPALITNLLREFDTEVRLHAHVRMIVGWLVFELHVPGGCHDDSGTQSEQAVQEGFLERKFFLPSQNLRKALLIRPTGNQPGTRDR